MDRSTLEKELSTESLRSLEHTLGVHGWYCEPKRVEKRNHLYIGETYESKELDFLFQNGFLVKQGDYAHATPKAKNAVLSYVVNPEGDEGKYESWSFNI